MKNQRGLTKRALRFSRERKHFGNKAFRTRQEYIPLTNRVRGRYRKLRTEFFPPRFMAQTRSAGGINRRGKNEDP